MTIDMTYDEVKEKLLLLLRKESDGWNSIIQN